MIRLRTPAGGLGGAAVLATLLALLAGLAAPGAAAPPDPPEPLSVHALTNVRIVTAPGRVIDSGTVVVRDGVIEAVGANVEPPADAHVLDLEGLTVYPGLIEPYAVRTWPGEEEAEPGGGRGGGGGNEAEGPGGGHPNPVVHAEREMADHGLEARTAAQLRQAGYTTALAAPGSALVRGWSAVVTLDDGPLRRTLLVPRVAQHVRLNERGRGGYPESLMGTIALTRQVFTEARWYGEAWSAYEARPAQARPPRDVALAALAPAVSGDAPVVFESDDLLGTFRAAGLADELGLTAWIVASGEEYLRADEVAALDTPLLVPLAFPEAPSAPDDALGLELDELRHWKAAPGNPAALRDAGAEWVATSFELDQPKELHARMAQAIEAGLTADEALAAVTTGPARLLGLDDRLGTIEVGKIAHLAVADGDLFTEETQIREVWVDGRRHTLEERKPPEVEPAGEWTLEIDADGQEIAGHLILEGEAPSLDGQLTVMGIEVTLSSVEVSGKTVIIEFDGGAFGMPGPFEMRLDVEGDRLRGGGTGPPGAFSLQGTRVSGAPEPEQSLDQSRGRKEVR